MGEAKVEREDSTTEVTTEDTTEAREAREDLANSFAKSAMMSGFPTEVREARATMESPTTETLKVKKPMSKMKRPLNKKIVNCYLTPPTLDHHTTVTMEVRDPRDAERARATREEAVDTGKPSVNLFTSLLSE